ncbi:FMN-binding protein [Prevotella sp.]|uniref:FMN-binding protein n=1 Tax=Prevotella sp. TaxID=59823 RepID=UPI002F92C53F
MKTNSNSYTIIYSAILVVIVAFLLAFVYTALKPMQDANVALDQKKQILNSLNLRNLSNEEAEKTYNEFVKEQQDQERVYYKCSIKGKTVYVFPLKGMGLWGGISGYVAIEGSDMNTVYGVYFNHEGETAGLGAEIKDNQKWQELFIGKKVFSKSGEIVLGVKKTVKVPESEVDAVTGATLTSNGVDEMLKDGLSAYNLKALKSEASLKSEK